MPKPYLTTPLLTAAQMSISSCTGMCPTRVPVTSWLRSGCISGVPRLPNDPRRRGEPVERVVADRCPRRRVERRRRTDGLHRTLEEALDVGGHQPVRRLVCGGPPARRPPPPPPPPGLP